MSQYYYSFNRYLQNTFGERVHRLSLNAGFKCPNIDGTLSEEGCIFCNNKAFSYFFKQPHLPLKEQIAQSMEFARSRYGAQKYIAYFQSFTNTYADLAFLKKQYSAIRGFKDIVGLAISTRPDCIDEKKLNVIDEFTADYEVYLEYGLQTVHEKTLKSINRNHTFNDFLKSVELTAKHERIKSAVHIILGLPGESKEDMLMTAQEISGLPLWGIKFHCLHVVRDTKLHGQYREGRIKLLSQTEYTDILVSFMERIPKEWVILRLVSDADRELLVAPQWINEKQKVYNFIEDEFKWRRTCQGALVPETSS